MWGGLREKLGLPCVVNDIHAQLNATSVPRVRRPRSVEALAELVRKAANEGRRVAIAGGRHAMGGQAFLEGSELIDMRALNGLVSLDEERRTARVQAGVLWPDLFRQLQLAQGQNPHGWSFRQKQTGGDRLSLGGAVAANIHSRGLTMRPFVDDVESLTLIGPSGTPTLVNRSHELFPLVVGGYGLFGAVAEVELRLVRRHKIRRVVEVRESDGLMDAFEERIAAGFEFGDFQFAIDDASDEFLRRGVFACYEPVEDNTRISEGQAEVPRAAWHHLVWLAHSRKAEAFRLYAEFYQKTNNQIYWSDLHQMTPYLDGYHARLDKRTGAACKGSEMITELYVPRERLDEFLVACRRELRRLKANVIYGTIRLIEADEETFLPWATERWACVIFNLHVDHSVEGIAAAQDQFRMLIDLAQGLGGSFYLTYHRWATREQVERSYPQMAEFLGRKDAFDPAGVFSSNWHGWLQSLMGESTAIHSPSIMPSMR